MALLADLGGVHLVNCKSGLQISAATSLVATCISSDSRCQSKSLRSILTDRSAWICRGRGLQLVLQFTVDGQSLNHYPFHELEALGRDIANAELWEQLKLNVSLSQLEGFAQQANVPTLGHHVTLNIQHSRSDDMLARPKLHRLSEGVPFADVKPPAGIPTFGLEKIVILLGICSNIKKLSKQELFSTNQVPYLDRHNLNHQRQMQLAEVEDEMLWASSESSEEHRNPSYNSDWSSVILPPRPPRSTILATKFDHLGGLVDAALRMVICSKPLHVANEVTVVSDNRITDLSSCAPAVWSPNYLSAVAQRECYLPTICHAMCQSIVRNAQSPQLKLLLQKLHNGFGAETATGHIYEHPNHESQPAVEHSAHKSINARLWSILQSGVLDLNAARKLEPIKFREAEGPLGIVRDSKMLDDWGDCFDEEMMINELSDEAALSEVDKSDFEMICDDDDDDRGNKGPRSPRKDTAASREGRRSSLMMPGIDASDQGILATNDYLWDESGTEELDTRSIHAIPIGPCYHHESLLEEDILQDWSHVHPHVHPDKDAFADQGQSRTSGERAFGLFAADGDELLGRLGSFPRDLVSLCEAPEFSGDLHATVNQSNSDSTDPNANRHKKSRSHDENRFQEYHNVDNCLMIWPSEQIKAVPCDNNAGMLMI